MFFLKDRILSPGIGKGVYITKERFDLFIVPSGSLFALFFPPIKEAKRFKE